MAPKRICLIGAGPSGMSVLYQLERLRKEGVDVPEVNRQFSKNLFLLIQICYVCTFGALFSMFGKPWHPF